MDKIPVKPNKNQINVSLRNQLQKDNLIENMNIIYEQTIYKRNTNAQ